MEIVQSNNYEAQDEDEEEEREKEENEAKEGSEVKVKEEEGRESGKMEEGGEGAFKKVLVLIPATIPSTGKSTLL